MQKRFIAAAVATAAILSLGTAVACSDSTTGVQPPPGGGATAMMSVTASIEAVPTLSKLVLTVTADDIDPSIIANLTLQGNAASGAVRVPLGQARTFTLTAYNAEGVATHVGSATVDILTQTPTAVAITLLPIDASASVPITATIGDVVISIAPSPVPDILLGTPVQLSLVVKDQEGNVIPNTIVADSEVTWATSNPAVADVDITGKVSGVVPGNAVISANVRGKAVSTPVKVTTNPLGSIQFFGADSGNYGQFARGDTLYIDANYFVVFRDRTGRVVPPDEFTLESLDTTIVRVLPGDVTLPVTAPARPAVGSHLQQYSTI